MQPVDQAHAEKFLRSVGQPPVAGIGLALLDNVGCGM